MGIDEDTIRAVVGKELAGTRADKAVAVLAGVSRSIAKAMLETGDATFDGRLVDPSAKVAAGAVLVAAPPEPFVIEPQAMEFDVLFEDADVAVVDKPAGVVVHPGAGNRDSTLASGILHRWPEVEGVGELNRWGIVHRLDRDTSGAILVAKTASAHERLSAALAERKVERRYVALVVGEVSIPTGTIEAPIGRDHQDPTRFSVTAEGRHAVTHYEVTERFDGCSLLMVTLETGRTHQIRVHLASIGHPVCGDRSYGTGGGPEVPRMFLHAVSVTFGHPSSGKTMTVDSPLPPELAAVVAGL